MNNKVCKAAQGAAEFRAILAAMAAQVALLPEFL